jgi:DNA polymerase III delta subunit
MPLLFVSCPSRSGPGERREALDRARAFLVESGVPTSDVVRVDVPERGSGEEGAGSLRAELESVVPMLQSGSLFGDTEGLELVDAQWLTASEAGVLAELFRQADLSTVAVAVVAEGSPPAVLTKVLKELGRSETVRKLWENTATRWLAEEVHRRDIDLDQGAVEALVQRFGTDTSSMSLALDQLVETSGAITAAVILDRFRNRPNEPIFHYTDAVAAGKVDEALRRLGDLLVHQHPLVVLAALETEVRRRSLALTAPDIDTYRELVGARPSDRWVERVWRQRGRFKDSSLRRAVDALVRADRVLKSAPEELHRVTMERLTVAMCRWLVGR